MSQQTSNTTVSGRDVSDTAATPGLTAKKSETVGSVSDDVLRKLEKEEGVWIRANGDLLEAVWTRGSLFKRVTITEDKEGSVGDGPGGELILAGAQVGERLLGLKVTAFAGGPSTKEVKKLAKDEKLLFVIDSRADVPGWIQKWHHHLQVPYDHPQLVGVHVARLVSVEFSREGHHQLLQKNPTSGGIWREHWDEAVTAGKLERRRETKNFGREPMEDEVEGRKAVEMRLGKATSPSHTVAALGHQGKVKEKGAATLFGGLALGPGHKPETTLATAGPVGCKRELSETSEDDEEKEALEARKAKRAKQPVKKVAMSKTRGRLDVKPPQGEVHMNTAFPTGLPVRGKTKHVRNTDPVVPEDASYLDGGASAQDTESEGKGLWTTVEGNPWR